uniref:Protein translocase subunit SecA n=1 Tax=Caloglossa intermedia TaxID=100879 RepID=A0A1Z1M6K0_9FLOR|nr:preprotein-translocase subunit a [Caloglossa intermedia]ARW61395.1 preprotein-translocase subunit a [Caloglossa intermedia]
MLNLIKYNSLNKYKQIVKTINIYAENIKNYDNEELKKQTKKLKQSLQVNKSNKSKIDPILPEAFATAKEAIRRATGITLFDVQILGAIILNNGYIAEMKTGEGKTLAAILPAYLNALQEKGVHILTVNTYLAKRDAELAQSIFNFLDLKIGLVTPTMSYIDRKNQYDCDITYTTNSELGFDYLRDNMAIDASKTVQRDFYFAIVDEVDSILIDEARTPIIISGATQENSEKYKTASQAASILKSFKDYEIDEKGKNVTLTEEGIMRCEKFLNILNLYNVNSGWIKYIINALKAKEFFLKNKEYIIKNSEIIIVDEFTGRIMEGRRWSEGLHQAIEAKENLPIQSENKTLASITYQNLFLLYAKLSGMTGTAKTEETEFTKIYQVSVIEIPTNQKCIRKDLPDLVYKSEYSKWQAVANECLDMYQKGRPTLIGTTSIDKSELLSQMLDNLQIPYKLLNAKQENASREAEIISQAGQRYSITISTNMAGRGTDIILGGNPITMAKTILKNHVKSTQKSFKSRPYFNNIHEKLYKSQKIDSLIKQAETSFLNENKNIDELGIDTYIEDVTNTSNLLNTKSKIDRKNFQIYQGILNECVILCSKEKKEVVELGGLYVIGTERHESRRIDNQLKGRSGRQGDPGKSRFFLSLQDNIFRIFGGEQITRLMNTLKMDDDTPIESAILSRSLNSAQKKVEGYFYDIRKQLFEYDEVINSQRQAIYSERKKILKSVFIRDCIIEYGENCIDEMLHAYARADINTRHKILVQVLKLLNINTQFSINRLIKIDAIELKTFLYEQLRISYDLREEYLEQLRPALIRKLEKYYLLQQIDQTWQDHLEKMNLLKEYIGWRSYGQQDPLIEYKNEAFNLFISMVTSIRQNVIYLIMRSRLIVNI